LGLAVEIRPKLKRRPAPMSLAQFKGRPAFLLLPPSHCHITGRAAIHSWVMVVAGVSPLRWRPTAERASTSGGPHEPQTTEQDHKADDPSNPVCGCRNVFIPGGQSPQRCWRASARLERWALGNGAPRFRIRGGPRTYRGLDPFKTSPLLLPPLTSVINRE